MHEVARGAFYPKHGVKGPPAWGERPTVLIQILQLKLCFFLIMSKLILVQNNHFSKVCTIYFSVFKIKANSEMLTQNMTQTCNNSMLHNTNILCVFNPILLTNVFAVDLR